MPPTQELMTYDNKYDDFNDRQKDESAFSDSKVEEAKYEESLVPAQV